MEGLLSFAVASVLYREEPVNVFYLDHDPARAARAHCDTHVVKMPSEAAQLLSTAWHVLANPYHTCGTEEPLLRKGDPRWAWVVPPAAGRGLTGLWPERPDPLYPTQYGERPYWLLNGQRVYDLTHPQHPSATWVRASTGNYRWAHHLGIELCREYARRYGRMHASEPVLWTLEEPPPGLPEGPQTEPVPVVPEHCAVVRDGYYDAVASYRLCYATEKAPLLRWKGTPAPSWLEWSNKEQRYVVEG